MVPVWTEVKYSDWFMYISTGHYLIKSAIVPRMESCCMMFNQSVARTLEGNVLPYELQIHPSTRHQQYRIQRNRPK